MKPLPTDAKRTVRIIVSLPNDVSALILWEPGHRTKSHIVDQALRLYYAMSEKEREARLLAIKFNCRATVQ